MRNASIKRHTSETKVALDFTIDGEGKSNIKTGIPFLDHMLDLFTKHGLFNLTLKVDGDLDVDFHHSTEDAAICLGQATHKALGDCAGIVRYASGHFPMDEALSRIALDISGRPHLTFAGEFPKSKVGEFDVELVEEFFHAFVNNAKVSLHIDIIRGNNLHHIIESIFKGFGQVLDRATRIDPLKSGVPSTKGML
jgi:imidazoleglycerol-phosphate dehydratase